MVNVHLNFLSNIGFTIQARQFSLISDEPLEFGGDDRGISAVELLPAAIGSCAGTSFSHCLKNVDIVVEDIQVQVDGKLGAPRGNSLASGGCSRDSYISVSARLRPHYPRHMREKFQKLLRGHTVCEQRHPRDLGRFA